MGLLDSLPKQKGKTLTPIPGFVPRPEMLPPGCKFSDRCRYATARCSSAEPDLRQISAGHFVRCIRAEEISWNS